jgi:hypothetical protein
MSASFEQIIESIGQLTAAEQERIRQWLQNRVMSNGLKEGSQGKAARSARSLRWLEENRKRYSGQWVALDGDRLIASGPTAKEVYSKAKSEGFETPFVELVTEPEPSPFTGGWLS